MPLKDNWVPGELYTSSDANAVATQVNTNTTDIAGAELDFVNNVQDVAFGAVGDGITDDTVAIAAALAVGGITVFPAGTYLTDPIVLDTGAHLVGAGVGHYAATALPSSQRTILELKDNSNAPVVQIPDGSWGVILESLEVDGNAANQTTGNRYGVHFAAAASPSADNACLRDVQVYNTDGDGVVFGTNRVGLYMGRVKADDAGGSPLVLNGAEVTKLDHQVVTATGIETLTNKTLTSPKINEVRDANGNLLVSMGGAPSAVNSFHLNNTGAGGFPEMIMQGTDTNISFRVTPKGTGGLDQWVGSSTTSAITVSGSQTNIDQNIVTKGTGRLKENGNIAATWVSVPSTATSTGKQGQMAANSSFLYICTATDTWRRVAIASW